MRSVRPRLAVLAVLALATVPAVGAAQRPTTRRRQAPIEIKGQVPTPQVVTVRPREVPSYSRQVLVPRFYDHDFWPDIQTGYQMVPQRQITGRAALDSLGGAADSAGRDTSAAGTRAPTTPRGVTPAAPPSGAPLRGTPPAAPPDSTRRTPGTASAPPAR